VTIELEQLLVLRLRDDLAWLASDEGRRSWLTGSQQLLLLLLWQHWKDDLA